jgi:hypothetical protein
MCLLTILIDETPELSQPNEDIRSVEQIVLECVSAYEDMEGTVLLTDAVHGTAFVSSLSHELWDRLLGCRLFQNIAVIPCSTVHGGEYDESEPGSIRSLAIAITMRVDQRLAGRRP